MKLRRRFSSSLRTLLIHKVRSLLALTGVAIGVAAVVLSRAIGDGAQQEMVRAVEGMGTSLLVVKPLQVKRTVFRPAFRGAATTLTSDDLVVLTSLPAVARVAPAVEGKVRVKAENLSMKATLRGTTEDFLPVRRFALEEGRFFDANDAAAARCVAVVGARVNRELGRGGSLLGKTVRFGGVLFEVIGTLQEKGTTADGANEDDQILIPLKTALRRVFNQHWLTAMYVQVADPQRIAETEETLRGLLRERHGLAGKEDDFAVQNTSKVRAFQQEMTASLSRYATWLAAIALGIGGFGIMALLFISVRERTGEIGLRIAVGAVPRDILWQFLIEAGLLAFGGWLAGCLLAAVGAAGVSLGSSLPMLWPFSAVLLSLAVTVLIGLGFGALPARTAARIPPIQALLKQ